jgi:hypothetical protein
LAISRGNDPEVPDFVKEAFGEDAILVEEATEYRLDRTLLYGKDIGPSTARIHLGAQGIGVISEVAKQDIAFVDGIEHGCSHRRLALRSV